MTNQQGIYFVGVDAGGTGCRALIQNQQAEIIASGQGGPANAWQDFDLALESIQAAILQACEQATIRNMSSLVVGMGVAGANISSVKHALKAWAHPWLQVHVSSDLDIACLAEHGEQDGGIIVLGTGSCAYARVSSQVYSWGGHGFPIGDKASGAWLGLKALEMSLLSVDGLAQETLLLAFLFDFFNCSDELGLIQALQGATQRDFAALAPLVFKAAKQDDQVALSLIAEAVTYIENMVTSMSCVDVGRIVISGGLADAYRPYFSQGLSAVLLPAEQAAEYGALLLAQQGFESIS
ncbi:BadF/BadG/BcrA/BcrD ATPase family protein [Agaribacterium sp. ZY112]|uniref:BadF/BadG/BcrA/BcrD ATPase family protein n=1 Tax=Agaribacterium sp. ZY112 TaxID=3233574 RepID=UPI003525F530